MGKFSGFVKEAAKVQGHLRMAITGPSGSGKTFSAINILMEMGCQNILVLDTEQGSAAKYRKEFPRKFKVIDNDCWKGNYNLESLTEALRELGGQYDGIVVDSLSHFWFANGGALDQVEIVAKRIQVKSGKYDSFAAWKVVTKQYNELITTILNLPCHFIGNLRAKTEYADEEVNGKKKKVKVGMGAQMRDGFEYEFDIQANMDMDHNMTIDKTRCRSLDGQLYSMPGANIAKPIMEWLSDYDVESNPRIMAVPEAAPSAPSSSPSVPSSSFETLLVSIQTAPDEVALKAIGVEIRQVWNDKQISPEEYKKLAEAFKVRTAELRSAAA